MMKVTHTHSYVIYTYYDEAGTPIKKIEVPVEVVNGVIEYSGGQPINVFNPQSRLFGELRYSQILKTLK